MTKRILLVTHLKNEPTDDFVAGWLRVQNCRLEVVSPSAGEELPDPNLDEYDGAVIYGGVQNITELDDAPFLSKEVEWAKTWIERDKGYVGICLGGQIMSAALGGVISRREDDRREVGYVCVEPTAEGVESGFLTGPLSIFEWHQEQFSIPDGCVHLASSGHFSSQAISFGKRAYGFQFHPEVTRQVIKRWAQ